MGNQTRLSCPPLPKLLVKHLLQAMNATVAAANTTFSNDLKNYVLWGISVLGFCVKVVVHRKKISSL